MSVTPAVVFYTLLVLATLCSVHEAVSLRGRNLKKTTIYELTDRASWVVGGMLLALVPVWWKWPVSSYIGAVLVSIIGSTATAALAQLVLGLILQARSFGHAVYKLSMLGVLLLLMFLAFRMAMWIIRAIF